MAIPQKLLWFSKVFLALVFLAALVLLLLPGLMSSSTMELEKADAIPDIKQTDERFAFPHKGLEYCAPVVVLDSFLWLGKNGYPKILEGGAKAGTKEGTSAEPDNDTSSGSRAGNGAPGSEEPMVSTCKKLAQLMDTRPGTIGTTTEQFLNGLKNYIQTCTPYRIASLKYEGWNRHPQEFDNGKACPDLDFIKQGIRDKRCEWLNIGWYKINPVTKIMERQQGHWVTLVGYGVGLSGIADPNTLIVRDPSPVLSREPQKIFITVEKLTEGKLIGPHEGLPREAKDYLFIKSMGTGVDSSGNRQGLIDGAIVLELAPPWLPK